MNKCAKCDSPTEGGGKMTDGSDVFDFCKHCFFMLVRGAMSARPVWTLLKHDQDFPMTVVDRNMLQARIARNKEGRKWKWFNPLTWKKNEVR